MKELLEAIQRFAEWHGAAHEKDCPEDDTCNCKGKPINEGINDVIRTLEFMIEKKKDEGSQAIFFLTEAQRARMRCYCCHHERGQCSHCPSHMSGLDKLLNLYRGNALPSSVCRCNDQPVKIHGEKHGSNRV